MKKFFITGTGTGVGKTLITCALAHQFTAKKKQVMALKPIITGFEEGIESDTAQLLLSMNKPVNQKEIESISPWRFAAPLSPDMAAEKENRKVTLQEVVDFCHTAEKNNPDILLIEGAGGVMTPLNKTSTLLDWMAELGYKVILVTGSYLGALSHSLTAIEAMQGRGIKPACVIVSESPGNAVGGEKTLASLRQFLLPEIYAMAIPQMATQQNLWKMLPDITHFVEKA